MTRFQPPSDEAILKAWSDGTLGPLVEQVLGGVIGEPFVEMGRAGDMAWLGFGPEIHDPTPRNPERRLAIHRLHLQCPFRLDGPAGPVVGAFDMYLDPANPAMTSDDFAWDVQGHNVFDKRVAAFWQDHQQVPLICTRLTADRFGGFVLEVGPEHALRVFPKTSTVSEHWRYFAAGEASRHFVVLPEP
jgi:hypothetical protein